jgi:iron complex outermembrane receptor protein
MNTINHYLRYCALLCTITLLSHAVLFGNEAPSDEQPIYQLEDFVVSAGPVARSVDDFASPFSSFDSEEIQQNSGSSIGELLEGQPGLSSTSFGSAASRPVIRGFDGARVRILDSGIEALDASSISVDHAVATEPLLLERVEILRGPSTLLYGSSAIGGVVNMIGREIPRSPVSRAGEVEGGFKTSYDSASSGETTLGYIKAGGENWAMSVTGLTRDNNDYEIPGYADLGHNDHSDDDDHDDHDDHDDEEEQSGVLENSFVETESYSIGNTWFFNEGSYFGLSYSSYNSLYGVAGHSHEEEDPHTPGEPEPEPEPEAPTIVDLERKRYDAELVLIEPLDWIKAARVRFGRTDYMHVESEGDHSTRYDNEGWELRGEIAHDSFASFDAGVVGIQFADSDFSAIGEEAFTPESNTKNQAIFISEHIHNGDLHWEFGARVENQTVDPSAKDRLDLVGSSYSDTALSLAVSAIWDFAENQSLTLSLQRSQRHPSSTELYALGAHIATSQHETGDEALGLETAYGIDLQHKYTTGNWSTKVSAFYTTFDDYIYSRKTGEEFEVLNDEGKVVKHLDKYEFEAVEALFWGFEAEANYIAYQSEGNTVAVGLLADYVRATNESNNTNLPRITPMRIGGKLRIENGAWAVGALLRQNFKQSNNADQEKETETASFTELQIDLSHSFELEGGELTLFAQGRNLLDEDIRRHTSFIKDNAPQPGRSVNVGLSYKF